MIKDVLISKGIIRSYFDDLEDRLESDVIIIGAGPSGLVSSYLMAKKGLKVTIFEKRNQPGGRGLFLPLLRWIQGSVWRRTRQKIS